MKKRFSLWLLLEAGFCVAALGIFGVWGCSRSPNNSGTLNVGVIMPMTGNVATLGKPCYEGMDLAVQEFNDNPQNSQIKVRLIPEDTAGDPKTAVTAFEKLATIDHVPAVLGPLTSTEALAVAPLAQRHRVLMISPGASTPDLSSAGDYVFRNELSDKQGGTIQASLAYEKLGYRRVGIIYMNNDYGVGLYTVFRDVFQSLGGKVVSAQAFQPDSVSFRTHLAKIDNSSPDAVLVIAVDEVVNILRQAKELGLNVPFFTTPIFENYSYVKQLGPLAEGVIYVYYGVFDPESTNPVVSKFVSSYHRRFGDDPTYYSAQGYDAGGMLLQAWAMSKGNISELPKHLAEVKGFPGVTGSASFDQNGDVQKPVVLKVVKEGKFVMYSK